MPAMFGSRKPTQAHRNTKTMQQATYNGYVLWGHAIEQQEEVLAPTQYAASGTITRERKFIVASGLLGVYDTEEEAQDVGRSSNRFRGL